MGPNLLLDKSSLQSISKRESYLLFRHYNVVLTPVLFMEILGDLKKGTTGDGLSKDEVKWLAGKILASAPYLCAPAKQLCASALLGRDVPMIHGQVPMSGGRDIETEDGKRGVFFDEPQELKALRSWAGGNFSEAEILLASKWRETTLGVDLESYKKEFLAKLINFRPLKSYEELRVWIDSYMQRPVKEDQLLLLSTSLDEMQQPDSFRTQVTNRWLKMGMPRFQEFAPYAAHRMRARLTFELSLASGLITTKPTNRVDLLYLYYLPFCNVFSSGDKLHEGLAPTLLRNNQMFVRRDDLKADLKWLADEWDGLTDSQRDARRVEYGSYPPESDSGSATLKAWQRFCGPRTPQSGNRALTMTPEQKKATSAEIQKYMRAIEKTMGKAPQ